jgi:hypothetical protein
MGDMGDDFRAMTSAKKERHDDWSEENFKLIRASVIKFSERPTALIFRNANEPRADFYPDTGRWTDTVTARIYRGGAAAFLTWYARQKLP